MAREIKRKDKICIVCGIGFKATASAQTCTPACRMELVRLKAAKKRPEYILVAKGKGQKIPDLNAPKRVKYKKGEKAAEKKIAEILNAPEVQEASKKAFSNLVTFGQTAVHIPTLEVSVFPPLTKEQILTKTAELERKKKEVSERVVFGGSPKAHALQKSMEIDKLNEEIEYLKSIPPTNPPNL